MCLIKALFKINRAITKGKLKLKVFDLWYVIENHFESK